MKYLGGKQRLGRYIAPVLIEIIENNKIDTYLEPFCGALGVLKNLTHLKIKIKASDYHPDLIAMWQRLQEGNFEPPQNITESEYNYYKLNVKSPDPLKGFVGFGSSFGGKFFAGYAQKYTNGKNENFCLEAYRSLKRIEKLIQEVEFRCQDYRKLNPTNTLIYCDPPYSKTKYPIKYRTDVKHYDVFDSEGFWEVMRRWSKNNIVVISETHAPEDFVVIWSMDIFRSACQSKKTRYKNDTTKKKSSEKLWCHKDIAKLII